MKPDGIPPTFVRNAMTSGRPNSVTSRSVGAFYLDFRPNFSSGPTFAVSPPVVEMEPTKFQMEVDTMGTWGTRRGRQRGFTLMELIIAMLVISILATVSVPRVASAMRSANLGRAARTVALDLELALSLAARQRAAVDIVQTAGSLEMTIQDAEDATVFLNRNFADGSSAKISVLTLNPTQVRIFPTGRTSAALTVTVGTDAGTRTITMSQAGQVRVTQ